MPESGLAARLRELHEAATPGPWTAFDECKSTVLGGDEQCCIADCFHPHNVKYSEIAANAELIAELRTNLPALLAALEDAERYRWLRSEPDGDQLYAVTEAYWDSPEAFDKAIDAARQQGGR